MALPPMEGPSTPTLADVRRAAAAIAPYLSLPTPLVHSPAQSERLDAHVSLKLEFANPVGVFKLSGGLFLAGELSEDQRRAGLVTASTGNHGQSIAYGAQRHGVRATIFVPLDANPDKVAAIERLGGEVHRHGERFDDARLAAEAYAAEHGMRYVYAANEPLLIAGVATAALEVLERQQPETELAAAAGRRLRRGRLGDRVRGPRGAGRGVGRAVGAGAGSPRFLGRARGAGAPEHHQR